jgi:F-type H+-transporting ATPase subunit delta
MPVIEKRYAKALIDTCDGTANLDVTLAEFGDFMSIYTSNNEFRLFLTSHAIKNSIKKETLNLINGLNLKIKNLIFLLLDKGRLSVLSAVYDEFVREVENLRNILHIKIFSASPLDNTTIDKLSNIFKARYKKNFVKPDLIVDKSLLGGIKIQIGDTVIDSTIKGKLNKLSGIIGASI